MIHPLRRARRAAPRLWPPCLVGLLCAAAACAPGVLQRRPPWAHLAQKTTEPADEANARKLWHDAREAGAAGDGNRARALETQLRHDYPTSEAAAWAYEAGAQRAAMDGNAALELDELEHVLYLRPHYAHADRVQQNYTVRLVQLGRDKEALAQVRHLPAGEARDKLATSLLAPLADAGRGQVAIELMGELLNSPQTPAAERRRLQDWAQDVTKTQLGFNDVDRLWAAHGNDPSWAHLQPLLLLRLAKIHFHTHDEARAEALLDEMLRRFPNSPYAEPAARFRKLIAARFEVDPTAVGVLLPLSGRYKVFGERSLAAIQLAFEKAPNVKLIVKDTQGEPTLAAQALDSLVLEHHIVAAIGPLFSAEATSAALKAEELGLPLLCLSHREGLTDVGRHVFRTALTVGAQAKALASTAFDQLGMRTFAVMAPKSRYGQDFLQAFWDEVEARRGEIRGVELYEPEQTTFREPVRRLVGRWFLNARPEYREALKALKERDLSGLRMRVEVDRLDKRSPPIVDFEGLVIPDSGRQIGMIAPALAFEDLALTQDDKALEKMRKSLGQEELKPITLLGASTWNSQSTLDSCEQYCENAVFVDGYFAQSPEVRVRDFVQAFRASTGAEPLLTEAQAFDTAGILAQVLGGRRPVDKRHEVVDALLKLPAYPGVCGRTRFRDNGEAERELVTLTIRNRRIQPLVKPTRRASR